MDFGNQIKNIRKKESLTQEQFAIKLNVSRQAVSNWENNKNLPDIGILLLVIKDMSVEYIDANGILHENFFLVPIGFMCIFCGLISFVSIGIRTIVIKIKDRND